jgi:hypothetical protein
VLFFYPKDFTFVCPTEIRGYEALAPRFRDADATLLGASVDSVHVHRAWVEHGLGKVSFPLVGDVTRRLAQAFGVLLKDEGVAARATSSSIRKGGSRVSQPMRSMWAGARLRRCASSRPSRRVGSPPANGGRAIAS